MIHSVVVLNRTQQRPHLAESFCTNESLRWAENGWLPSSEAMNNLQCKSVKKGGVVYTQDIKLDPTSNAIDVSKCGAHPEITIMLSASCTHQSHILDQREGCDVLKRGRHLCDFLNSLNSDQKVPVVKVDNELI